jgi:Fe-S-cluster-containing hydrogenase component 2
LKKQKGKIVVFKMSGCGGCRTCEIACSFKHTGEFIPAASSIKILDREDGLGFDVCLIDESGEKSNACDGCLELDEPMCLQYCEKREDLKKILQEFLEKSEPKGT